MAKSILLADDSLTIQKVIELTFSDTDYELTTVSNGGEALAALERQRPDLVMADVVMPGKNGYEVCEAIKSNPALADIPVILLSGTFEPFDRERAERARANAIVTKPFDSKNLLVQVETLLHGRRPSPTTVAVPAAPEPTLETRAFPASDVAHGAPSDSGLDFAEFPAESAFEAEPAGRDEAGPLDAERPGEAAPSEPLAFPMDDTSPFGRSAPSAETGEPAASRSPEPFSDDDNVFEFPALEPASERETESPSIEIPSPWAARTDQEVTQELVATRLDPPPEFPAEPVFLHHEPELEPEPPPPPAPEPAAPERAARVSPAREPMSPARPVAEAGAREGEGLSSTGIASDIEELAQGASISDLAKMVIRIAAPASLSDEDVERISRRVVERLSEKIVRDIAWEVVPDLAEILVRQRLRELEAEPSGDSR